MQDDSDLPEDVRMWLTETKANSEKLNHFFEVLAAAEFHWFFIQGLQAIRSRLYVPGVSSLLNGVEASIRVTIAQISGQEPEELSPYRVLSNSLIRDAEVLGMPVHLLAFPGETDFAEKLASVKPNKVDVEIVRQRNNICHGNIFEFINRDLGPNDAFFTPECLRVFADALLEMSHVWADGLGSFRRKHNLVNH